MRRGLEGGFRPALTFQVGSIVGYVAWCPEALLERAQLVPVNGSRLLVGAAGVIGLAWLGVNACGGCRGHLKEKNQPPGQLGAWMTAAQCRRPGWARQRTEERCLYYDA